MIYDELALFHAAKIGDHAALLLLLKGGINPNIIDKNEMTPLHHAAKNGRKDCVVSLLKYGANPNLFNKTYFTPSHYVLMNKHYDCIPALIDGNADFNIKGEIWTPSKFADKESKRIIDEYLSLNIKEPECN